MAIELTKRIDKLEAVVLGDVDDDGREKRGLVGRVGHIELLLERGFAGARAFGKWILAALGALVLVSIANAWHAWGASAVASAITHGGGK